MVHQEQHWELQLKGAGPTPYSRAGDGRAVLRSSIREFLCSEAMHYLGVPTTRALSLVATGDDIIRDMFYDGNAKPEPGAIVCRVSPSFIRFGNFEIFYSRDDWDNAKRLLDFTIQHYFPQFSLDKSGYIGFFHEVCRRTAELMAHWMSVGFVHGVMNTDNMSILGLTIDYGPYGWLDIYQEDWTPNTTDAYGRRYCYGNQPSVGGWNLYRLAQALTGIIDDIPPLQEGLEVYKSHFAEVYTTMRLRKMGFGPVANEAKAKVIDEFYSLMSTVETDMTILYRTLSTVSSNPSQLQQQNEELTSLISEAFYTYSDFTVSNHRDWASWLRSYIETLGNEGLDDGQRAQKMNAVNPKYICRNYLAQLAIDDAEKGDYDVLHTLFKVLQSPFDEHPENQEWAGRIPEWARNRAGCSMLSCSS